MTNSAVVMQKYAQTVIIGAGAAGLFCAGQLAKLGRQAVLLDSGKKIGRKILMSGGGFCNFTNLEITPQHYLSQNPHFVKSALARFTQWDFIAKVAEQGIAYHEKELGQLFCDESAAQIVELLWQDCQTYGVELHLRQQISKIDRLEDPAQGFIVHCNGAEWRCDNLVIATGGLSMPALGATPFGYQIAEQFGLNVIAPRAGLVPFTWRENEKCYADLAGISLPICVTAACGQSFSNQLLFTHRGLSGPAMLQISNYWQPNEALTIDWLPTQTVDAYLLSLRVDSPKLQLKTALSRVLPKKLVEIWIARGLFSDETLANLSKSKLAQLENVIHRWRWQPNGTEGYRTAEVTLGGVDTAQISSKTMECQRVSGLYFIGEVLDVTGWLGGYNFQWAWSSAYACACAIADKPILK